MLLSQGVQLAQEETSSWCLSKGGGCGVFPAKPTAFYELNISQKHLWYKRIETGRKAGRHLSLFSKSAKKLKSVGSRRQMPLGVEGWRGE